MKISHIGTKRQDCTLLPCNIVHSCITKVCNLISVDYQSVASAWPCEVDEVVYVFQCLFILIRFLYLFMKEQYTSGYCF